MCVYLYVHVCLATSPWLYHKIQDLSKSHLCEGAVPDHMNICYTHTYTGGQHCVVVKAQGL